MSMSQKINISVSDLHYVNGRSVKGSFPETSNSILLGMGCFWGAEQKLWMLDGVWITSSGFAGGKTENPTYQETCDGTTGHVEVVRVVYDPAVLSTESLLQLFWESHDPTQGMRQGNDVGDQYRSAIYCESEAQLNQAIQSRDVFQKQLTSSGFGDITTEIRQLTKFFFAEDYHQQYLAKNPEGYCGLKGTGVVCPI